MGHDLDWLQSQLSLSQRWEPLEKIGEGGFSSVFLVRDAELDRLVAFKVAHANDCGDGDPKKLRELALAEASKMAKIQHRNVLHVNELLKIDGLPILVLDYVSGGDLHRRIRSAHSEGPISVRERCLLIKMVRDVCEAVHFVHAQNLGLIHCDIKPGNILIDSHENPLLTDFGLSMYRTDEPTEGSTVLYAAPEQFRLKPVSQTDVYALGSILYEIITGRTPFEGVERNKIPIAKMTEAPEPPSSWVESLDPGLDDICLKCLELDPSKRYRNPSQLSEELKPFASHGVSLVPFDENKFFTRHDDLVGRIREKLRQNPKRRAAISGLGGMGKTQTAVQYSYKNRSVYESVLWVHADEEVKPEIKQATDPNPQVPVDPEPSKPPSNSILASIFELTQQLVPARLAPRTINDAAEYFRRWLTQNENWLLVFDNADDPKTIEEYLPNQLNGDVLITSRARPPLMRRLGVDPKEVIQLNGLSIEEGTDFLLERTGLVDCDDKEKEAATQLAREFTSEEFGILPLGLEQAAAYIDNSVTRSFAQYLAAYRARKLKLLERAGPELGKYKETVLTTWDLNFKAIESEAAVDLLRISSFLSPDRIPFELIVDGREHLGEPISNLFAEYGDLAIDELLSPLTRYSLIRVNRIDSTYSMHRLVQDVQKFSLDTPELENIVMRLVRALSASFPTWPAFENWPTCRRFINHVLATRKLVDECEVDVSVSDQLFYRASDYLSRLGSFNESEELLQLELRTVDRFEDSLLADTSLVSSIHNSLAEVYRKSGRFDEAQALYERFLPKARHDGNLGYLAVLLNNYGLLCQELERWDAADAALTEALEIRRNMFGEVDEMTAQSLGNLGRLYHFTNRKEKAYSCISHALKIEEGLLGPNDPAVGVTLNNLATLLIDMARFDEAEPLMVREMELTRNALGENHHEYAMSLHNYANLLKRQGDFGAAIRNYDSAIKIKLAAYKRPHPSTASSLIGLANTLLLTGEANEASSKINEALEIQRHVFGLGHKRYQQDLLNCLQLLSSENTDHCEALLRKNIQWHREEYHPNLVNAEAMLVNLLNESKRRPIRTYSTASKKIGRNDPCPCRSGKKYKKCCLRKKSFQ